MDFTKPWSAGAPEFEDLSASLSENLAAPYVQLSFSMISFAFFQPDMQPAAIVCEGAACIVHMLASTCAGRQGGSLTCEATANR